MLPHSIRILILIYTSTLPMISIAQKVRNPSFEDTPRESISPSDWVPCHQFSTPDTQPGFWEVSKQASNGNTYIGLVTRGNDGPYANQNEDVQTTLVSSISINDEFIFSIDLSLSQNWGHFIGFGSTFLTYDTPAKLQVYGGTNSCSSTELLWESPTIDHVDWKTYEATLNPTTTEVNYLIFKAAHTGSTTYFGNLLMDNIVECNLEVEWVTEATICEDEHLEIDVTVPNGTYLWQDGSIEPIYTIEEAGTYSVTVSIDCTSQELEIEVQTKNCYCDTAVPIQTTAFDSTACADTEITLDAWTPGGFYNWSTGSLESSIRVSQSGKYSVEVSNRCEIKTFDYVIEKYDCSCEVSAPNVFTPNGDGINETFEITGTADISRYHLRIFNTSGSEIFNSNDIEESWNGTRNNRDLPPGVYYYVIELMCVQGNTIVDNSYKGWITIVR